MNCAQQPDTLPRRFSIFHLSVAASLASVSLLLVNSIPPAKAAAPESDTATYLYSGDDLGAVYSPQQTVIKVWAPTAKEVHVLLFQDPTSDSAQNFPMTRDAGGIWSVSLPGDLDGKYYLYELTHPEAGAANPTVYRVNDPYARGASANTGRTLIFDAKKTNPDGWAQDRFVTLKQNVDAVIYEAHIRDFSIHKNSGTSDERRGRYLGMVQEGTRSPSGEKTGIDHLKELGISHVHILPTFDYANGNETQAVDQYTWYNWGYDPVLYNTPEGSYATQADGTARQKEYKQMIQAFHKNNLGVIFDAVYNHTASTGNRPTSIFDKVVPKYYYRLDQNGRYANGTGCGNEFASEKPMARKFIVDSVKYWMTEYHVDGFRFDLLGIEDRETMLEVYREAKKINPNVIIYGEGWSMEKLLPADKMMTQANVKGTGLAAFNDGIRDNLKGDVMSAKAQGFVQGAGPQYGGMERLWLNIKGQSTGRDKQTIEVFSPNETINYVSCHDDHCLWDKLVLSTPEASEATRISMDKLAIGAVLTSQGVPFLHAGDEFLRTKNLAQNSHSSNDPRVNWIDWTFKTAHKDAFNFVQGMLALRRAHPAFRMSDKARVDEAFEFAKTVPGNAVEYVLKNNANGDTWKAILVVLNGNKEAKDLKVTGNWSIVANDKAAGIETLATAQNTIHVEPFSLVVAHTDGPYQLDPNP